MLKLQTSAVLTLDGAMDLLQAIMTDPDGWTVTDLTCVGVRQGEARYRLRLMKGNRVLEADSYIPWRLLREDAQEPDNK